MKIKLYLDEDAQRKSLIFALQRYKIDVLTPNDMETTGFTDEEQLEFATSLNRTILTYNAKDFAQLHSEFLKMEKSHAGIIIIQQINFDIGKAIHQLSRLLHIKSAEEIQNNIEYLNNW
ncbi:hypothetical protein BH20ACI1_BH20ACI1_19700 [soil metagenome]